VPRGVRSITAARRHRVSDFQHIRHAQAAKRGTDGRRLWMRAGHRHETDAIVGQRIDRCFSSAH
jgi:hypothetical protein